MNDVLYVKISCWRRSPNCFPCGTTNGHNFFVFGGRNPCVWYDAHHSAEKTTAVHNDKSPRVNLEDKVNHTLCLLRSLHSRESCARDEPLNLIIPFTIIPYLESLLFDLYVWRWEIVLCVIHLTCDCQLIRCCPHVPKKSRKRLVLPQISVVFIFNQWELGRYTCVSCVHHMLTLPIITHYLAKLSMLGLLFLKMWCIYVQSPAIVHLRCTIMNSFSIKCRLKNIEENLICIVITL